MNRKYGQLIKDINDGKNLEIVLPEYSNELSRVLYEYSLLQSAMEFYSLKEMIDEDNQLGENTLTDVNRLFGWIQEIFKAKENGTSRELHIQEIDSMRTEIMEKMDILTMYTDQLQIFEYVLNRKELEYEPVRETISDEAFAGRLYQYIFSTKDNVLINQRIKDAVGQLPVRILKSKYFEYLKESINCYKDADKSSVDTFIYMLRTSGMVYKAKVEEEPYPSLKASMNTLQAVDYTSLSKEEYIECLNVMKKTSSTLVSLSDFNYQIEKVINSLYIYLLLRPYAFTVDATVEDNCTKIIMTTLENMDSSLSAEVEENIGGLFDDLLGIQEQLIEDYQYLSCGLSVINESLSDLTESIALDSQIHCLTLADKLCGNSIFIDLHHEANDYKVPSEYIEYQLNHLVIDLTEMFKKNPQCINRAIMAATLSKLPVFFNNSKEVQEYIEHSLSQCQNEAEKVIAKELLLSLMTQEES